MLRSNLSAADGAERMEARLQVVTDSRVYLCLLHPFGHNALNLGVWGLAPILNRQELEVPFSLLQHFAVALSPICS
jgi:hypothetical protein